MLAWTAPPVPRLRSTPAIRPLLFDTASQAVVPVGPESGTARMYVCGITPYDATHLGHAKTYLTFDLLHRVWLDAGLDVHYVQNVTDVDDPLLERADATGVDWRDLAADQVELFRTDMTALRVLPPRDYIGAVESIPWIRELLGVLDERGVIYPVDDAEHPDRYLANTADPHFGEVSRLDRDDALATFAERGGDPERAGKRDALDALVWRLERPGEPAWDSEVGRGRPGWHIECTAIALRLLGENFDVQGGGSDLVFPHHEMSATTARLATGQPFAQAYAHGGMVGLDGEKMSKSRGNLVLVSRLRAAGVDPMAIRLGLLAHHYRSDWSWSDDVLAEGERRLARWRQAAGAVATAPAAPVVEALRAALADDLDSPAALAAVDAWAEDSVAARGTDTTAVAEVAAAVDALLGVDLLGTRTVADDPS